MTSDSGRRSSLLLNSSPGRKPEVRVARQAGLEKRRPASLPQVKKCIKAFLLQGSVHKIGRASCRERVCLYV